MLGHLQLNGLFRPARLATWSRTALTSRTSTSLLTASTPC